MKRSRSFWSWEAVGIRIAPAVLVVVLIIMASLVSASCSPLGPGDLPSQSSANYGWLREDQFAVTATGTAGSAVGTQDSDAAVYGHLYAIHLDFAPSISVTTDITMALVTPLLTIFDITNLYTDTWVYPAVQQTGSGGVGTSTYDRMPVSGRLMMGVAQTTATTVVTATVLYGE